MEDDDLRIHRAASSHDHHSHLALKQAGRKSTSLISRDRSIDSSVTSPHTTAARKVTPISQSHGSQSALPSKRIRPHVSSAQNTSMGPPIATTNNTRWTNELLPFSRRVSEELHSSQTSQNPGSQGIERKFPRHSLPLPSASIGHRARTYVRKTAASNNLTSETASVRRQSVITAAAPEIFAVKSANALVPLWHLADDEYQASTRTHNRTFDNAPAGFDFIKRVTISSARHQGTSRNVSHRARSSNHPAAFLGPGMQLRAIGRQDDTRMDEGIPQPRPINDLPPRIQMGVKAARKREWPPRPDSDSESELSEQSAVKSQSSESSDDDQRPESDAEKPGTEEEEEEEEEEENNNNGNDVVEKSRRSFSPPEIEFLESAPRAVKTLAPSPPQVFRSTQGRVEPSTEPSEELIAAVETLTLSSVHMQKVKRLPFLLRNLRRGFISRCRSLNIPTQPTPEEISVTVRYEYSSAAGEHAFETRMEQWICPCCELYGTFQTREMLTSHLNWDHDEVLSQWNEVDDDTVRKWFLRLVIPEPQAEDKHNKPRVVSPRRTTTPPPDGRRSVEPSLSPFPYVTLSPPTAGPSLTRTASTVASPVPQKLKFQVSSATATRPQPSPLPSSARGRSTTAMSAATSSTQKTPRPARYPTPPPSSDPLGPAAQPPYLPAKSEYGGPDVSYSCRPNGVSLYDLLNTLPLEPFGVLAWDVLDREDEIYDSDNVKDEYKVMHALWARWIVLNRNTFIANYYKGTIAFVDAYWKMIHRAAGWDALRFWLLLLLSERFITAHEVANILRHYEGLTGMELWYD